VLLSGPIAKLSEESLKGRESMLKPPAAVMLESVIAAVQAPLPA
jgi:hypothetical protein